MTKIIGVYLIRNVVTQQVYVGSSVDVKKRIRAHRVELNKNKHKNPFLQKDWNETDRSLFDFSIQEVCEESILRERESYWIKHYESLNPEKGFNCSIPDNSRVPRKKDREKQVRVKKMSIYICINKLTGDRLVLTKPEIFEKLNINNNAVAEISSYWRGNVTACKTNKGWIVVNQLDFREDFDYVNYDKIIQGRLPIINRTNTLKKGPMPMCDRNIYRRPLLMQNITTGEEIIMPSVQQAISEYKLVQNKVYKCLQRDFGKYKHHNFHFRYL